MQNVILRPRQNIYYFSDDIFNRFFMYETVWIVIKNSPNRQQTITQTNEDQVYQRIYALHGFNVLPHLSQAKRTAIMQTAF